MSDTSRAKKTLVPAIDSLPTGVAHIELPTPFALGPVNCYVLLGDVVTIVDPGMQFSDTFERITNGLAGLGLALSDIDQVFVTHAHPDHFGAAAWVAERAGCEILASAVEAERLQFGLDRPEFWALLRQLGAPDDVVDNFPALLAAERDWMGVIDPSIVRIVADGAEIEAGSQRWRLIQTSGHAVGHLSDCKHQPRPGPHRRSIGQPDNPANRRAFVNSTCSRKSLRPTRSNDSSNLAKAPG